MVRFFVFLFSIACFGDYSLLVFRGYLIACFWNYSIARVFVLFFSIARFGDYSLLVFGIIQWFAFFFLFFFFSIACFGDYSLLVCRGYVIACFWDYSMVRFMGYLIACFGVIQWFVLGAKEKQKNKNKKNMLTEKPIALVPVHNLVPNPPE